MKFLLFILIFTFCFSLGTDAQQFSTFNKKEVKIDSTGNYSFIISGHFYGDGTNKSGYPANTLLANLDWINESDASMLICLGDLFMDIKNDVPKYKTSLFDKLEIPLFNAVGNHDLTADFYQINFGATYFKFQIGNDIHVILDTEENNGDIQDEQLQLLKDINDKLKNGGVVNNVFIYGHRTIFKDTYSELEGLFSDNTQSIIETNFEVDVLPILKSIANFSKVYWFAGSLGTAPASFFYFQDQQNKITYIATAIRALLRDAMLIVNVKNGEVTFETHSLTNQKVEELEHYNVDFWKSTSSAEPFNYRLIPLYIKNVLGGLPFWYGMGFAFLLVLGYKLVRRKKTRVK